VRGIFLDAQGVTVLMHNIIVIGLNHRTCPVEIREKLSIAPDDLSRQSNRLKSAPSVEECVIVSTCNRIETIALVDNAVLGEQSVIDFLSSLSGLETSAFVEHLYVHKGLAAVRHLFEVAAGLDSMILGETQILGQVKEAYMVGLHAGSVGTVLDSLFRRAVTAAKRAHTETELSQHAVSVSYAAVQLAKRIFEQLRDKTVLIIGAGKMSELTAKHMRASGAERVLVTNRTYERAVELAKNFDGQALPLDLLQIGLREADIVISSTGSADYVVTRSQVVEVMKQRRNRPLFLVDIAVPRDLDPAIARLGNVYLYDIDDLEGVVAVNVEERMREADKARLVLGEELVAFEQWFTEQGAVPVIAALRAKGSQVQSSVMQSLVNKLPDLTERERKIIEKHTMSIVNQLLREPVHILKEIVGESDANVQLAIAARLFGLEAEGLRKTSVLTEATASEDAKHSNRGAEKTSESTRSSKNVWGDVRIGQAMGTP